MKINLFSLLIVCCSAMAGNTILTSCSQTEEIQKPNIIFIMADDLGYSETGCYGQKLIKTPNIDRLAAEGMKFTQVYSGCSVCAPARSVLMTGLHTGHTTVRGNFGKGGVVGLAGGEGRVPLREEDITIAQLLQDAGYVTGMVGKWGIGEPNTSGEPYKKGFDEFFGFLNQRRAHSYYPEYIWRDTVKVDLPGNRNGERKEYTHALFADWALDFLERHSDEPFFLYVPFCIPHSGYHIPDQGEYKDLEWTEKEKTYAAMVSLMDYNIGAIMNKLKELGIDENTYVFFTSDNGVAENVAAWDKFDSSGPLKGTKRDPYEGGIRVPMIVRHPEKIKASTSSDLPWYFADVMPTLAEIANIPPAENIDGISVLPTLHGEKQDLGDRTLYWEFYEMEGWRVVRFGDWKAIQQGMHSEEPKAIELYNLSDDIGETRNLAAEKPELVSRALELFEKEHIPSEEFQWDSRQ